MYSVKNSYGPGGFEVKIDSAAYAILDSTWHQESVCDPFSRLYYIKEGRGWLQYRNQTIELQAGNVYLIPAECNFDYKCEYLEKIFFHIYVNTLEKYDMLSNVKKICSIPFPERQFDELKKCLETDDYIKLIKLKLTIYETLIKMSEKFEFRKVPIKQYSEGVRKAMEYIQRHTRINLNTETVCEKIFVSKSKLRKDFKSETGISIGKYIDDMVFFKAKRMLNKDYMSINEVSQKLGFCDQFYFSRRFKERYGQPPSEYRKQLLLEKNKGE